MSQNQQLKVLQSRVENLKLSDEKKVEFLLDSWKQCHAEILFWIAQRESVFGTSWGYFGLIILGVIAQTGAFTTNNQALVLVTLASCFFPVLILFQLIRMNRYNWKIGECIEMRLWIEENLEVTALETLKLNTPRSGIHEQTRTEFFFMIIMSIAIAFASWFMRKSVYTSVENVFCLIGITFSFVVGIRAVFTFRHRRRALSN